MATNVKVKVMVTGATFGFPAGARVRQVEKMIERCVDCPVGE
jgi:hypothetical protein